MYISSPIPVSHLIDKEIKIPGGEWAGPKPLSRKVGRAGGVLPGFLNAQGATGSLLAMNLEGRQQLLGVYLSQRTPCLHSHFLVTPRSRPTTI